MNKYLVMFVALSLTFSSVASANDGTVYESLESVSIGRVFLSPAERRWLDAMRAAEPSATFRTARTEAPTEPAPAKPKPAAGFIVNSSGQARIWRDGDFIRSNDTAETEAEFPGQVPVERHHPVKIPHGDSQPAGTAAPEAAQETPAKDEVRNDED